MEFLIEYRIVFLVTHILFMAIGLGGATVSDILFFKFLKDYRISKKEYEVLHVLKDVILTVIVVITLSGLALYLPESARFNASAMFLVKAIASAVLIINGILLHVFIAPYLIHLNLRTHQQMGRAWHRFAFALGGISICSWYSVFFIAMLKEELPFGFNTMLGTYCTLLVVTVLGTQIVESLLSNKAQNPTKNGE